jgi:uncharacterized membrane protein YagU involved in acid resistance
MRRSSPSLWRGALAGLVGGLLAAGAMSLAHQALPPPDAPADEGEDATVKAADRVVRRVTGQPLPEDRKPMASQLVHYAFGGVVGAVYGAAAELVPRLTTGLGLPFGLAVWLGAHAITVPALGLAESPARRPLADEAPELGLHAVYGAVAELARRVLRGGFPP